MLLDTTFLIDLLRGKDKKAQHMAMRLDGQLEPKCVASITIKELWLGAQLSDFTEREETKIDELLSSLLVFPFAVSDAKNAAEIEATLLENGSAIDSEDCMIAGVARTHGEAVLTRNAKHFKRVPRLRVVGY